MKIGYNRSTKQIPFDSYILKQRCIGVFIDKHQINKYSESSQIFSYPHDELRPTRRYGYR